MKLLIITQAVDRNDPILGFFNEWIVEFAKRFESVSVICLRKGDVALPSNAKAYSLGKERRVSKIGYVLNFFSLIIRLRKEYDAVFIHMNPIYAVLGCLFWKTVGKPTALWYTHKHVDLKLRVATALVDRVFTASRESFRIATKKVRVMGHGIDVGSFRKERKEKEGFVISTIGRVSETKNIRLMLEAFAKAIEATGSPMRFEVVGAAGTPSEKKYKASLEKLAGDLGLSGLIVFKGAIKNREMGEYLRGVDLTINASSTGSLDKAVLESLAAGVPVLTTNEAFKGMLSPLGLYMKDVDGLARAIAEIHKGKKYDSEALRSLVAKDHSLERLIGRIVEDIRIHP